MYEKELPDILRTGDIVKLDINDFEKIIRHRPLLKLFQDFEKNSDYSSRFWTILNKSCDMVHNDKRYFSNNLFLVPLQGLKSTLKKGTLGKVLYSSQTKSSSQILIDSYKKYFLKKIKHELPKRRKRISHRLQ